jgi:hypothetical protein
VVEDLAAEAEVASEDLEAEVAEVEVQEAAGNIN